jgi:hypothetical protein
LSKTDSPDSTESAPIRPWRKIARETAKEHDPHKELELAQELIRALDAESMHRMEQSKLDDNAKRKTV